MFCAATAVEVVGCDPYKVVAPGMGGISKLLLFLHTYFKSVLVSEVMGYLGRIPYLSHKLSSITKARK